MQTYTQLSLFDIPEFEQFDLGRKLAEDEIVRSISASDVRFGAYVRALSPRARSLGAALRHFFAGRAKPSQKALEVLRVLDQTVKDARSQQLEGELRALVCAASIQRVGPVLKYLGWDGRGGSTLQKAADESGITRERVRQLAAKVARRVAHKPFTPALDRILATLSDSSVLAEDIEERWRRDGLTAGYFRAEGVVSAASLVKGECSVRVRLLEGKRLIVNESADRAITAVRKLALASSRRFTVTSLRDLGAKAAGSSLSERNLAQAIEGMSGFVWLDRPSGWFWIKGRRSRLFTRIRKILSVANRISLGELRSGIARDHRMGGFAPPRRILAQLCRLIPGVRVEGEMVIADPPIDSAKTLSHLEHTMIGVLRESKGILPRETFEKMCLEKGVNQHSFWQYLSYSPLISKYSRGVYGIRGTDVEPGTAERLRPRVANRVVLKDYGYASGGRIWFGYCLSNSTVMSGIVTIPASMMRLLHGDYTLRSESGDNLGTLRSQRSRAWGLKPLILRKGLEAGDFLMLTFDLHSREVLVAYSSEELWDDLAELDATVARRA